MAARSKRARLMEEEKGDEEDRQAKAIARQRRLALASEANAPPETHSLDRIPHGQEEKIKLQLKPAVSTTSSRKPLPGASVFQSMRKSRHIGASETPGHSEVAPTPTSDGQGTEERFNSPVVWAVPNIVVKVLNKELADGRYFKKKGIVKKIHAPSLKRRQGCNPDNTIDADIAVSYTHLTLPTILLV